MTKKVTNPTTNTISTTLPTIETQTEGWLTKPTTNTISTTPPIVEAQTVGQAATSSSTTNTFTIPLIDETQTRTPSQQNTNTIPAAIVLPSSEAQMANQPNAISIAPKSMKVARSGSVVANNSSVLRLPMQSTTCLPLGYTNSMGWVEREVVGKYG
ncbi:Hypothetical predicted protein, partial [Olea europaea subsp. europaea]